MLDAGLRLLCRADVPSTVLKDLSFTLSCKHVFIILTISLFLHLFTVSQTKGTGFLSRKSPISWHDSLNPPETFPWNKSLVSVRLFGYVEILRFFFWKYFEVEITHGETGHFVSAVGAPRVAANASSAPGVLRSEKKSRSDHGKVMSFMSFTSFIITVEEITLIFDMINDCFSEIHKQWASNAKIRSIWTRHEIQFFFLVWASLQFTQLTKSAAGELAVGPRKALSFFPSPLRANLLKVAESVLYM